MDLAFDDLGEGAPWVLLHGFPLSRRMWDAQRPLAEHARLLLPDLRGFGASPAGPRGEPATMEAMASDVLGLCDALGLDRFGLGGFSMGGYAALAMQQRAPERVAALALLDTQPGADTEEARANRERLAQRVETEGMGVLVQEFLPKLLSPRGRADPRLSAEVRALIEANEPAGMAAALRGMALRADHTARLPRIACPALVVVGSEDELTPPAKSRAMAEALPDARLVVIEGAGHLSNVEKPDAVNEALGGFIREQAEYVRSAAP